MLKNLMLKQTQMKLKQLQNIYHDMIVNAMSIVQHVIQTKNGIINPVNMNE